MIRWPRYRLWMLSVAVGFGFPAGFTLLTAGLSEDFSQLFGQLVWSAVIPAGGFVLLCSVWGEVCETNMPQVPRPYVMSLFVSALTMAALIFIAGFINVLELAQSEGSAANLANAPWAAVLTLVIQVSFTIIGVWSSARIKEGLPY